MATQRGVGKFVVRGVQGTLQIVTGAVTLATADNKLTSVSVQDRFDVTEVRDGKGALFAAAAGEITRRCSIRMIPLDSSVSSTLAQAKTNIKLPGRLEKVTLASFGNTNVDGDWHYAGGEVSINADQVAEISMDLVRFGTTGYIGDPADFDA